MYVVRFVRKDRRPDEEYFYLDEKDAQYHFQCFENDDSELYIRVEIEKQQNGNNHREISKSEVFPRT